MDLRWLLGWVDRPLRQRVVVTGAVQDYLGLDGLTAVDWQFVARDDIPPGPWLQTITTSGVTH